MNASGMMCVSIISLLIARKAWHDREDRHISSCLILSSVGLLLGAGLSRFNLWFAIADLFVMAVVAVAYYVAETLRKKNATTRYQCWCTVFGLVMLAWICFAVVSLLIEFKFHLSAGYV